MEYYNTEGELVSIEVGISKHHGTCGNIYQLKKDIYLKKYYEYTSLSARLDYRMFQFLREIHHPFTNTILDLYYEKQKVKEKGKLLENIEHFRTDAYLFKYLKREKIDILKMPIDYLIYNLEELEKLMKLFAENRVKADDLKRDNAVFSGNKIVLIDLDNCKIKENEDTRILIEWNKRKLSWLFLDLFRRSESFSYKNYAKVSPLFEVEDDIDLKESVSRKLKKYKRPLDYLKEQ